MRILFNVFVRLSILLLRLLRPIVIVVVRWLSNLMTISIAATIMGPEQFIDRRASDWTRRLLIIGMSHDHIDMAHSSSRVIIGVMIVMGWAVTALFMVAFVVIIVAVFRVVFGLPF